MTMKTLFDPAANGKPRTPERREPSDIIPEDNPFVQRGWPPSLVKATRDRHDYLASVKNAGLIRFEAALPLSDVWVRLIGIDPWQPGYKLRYAFPRGLDIRIADIQWCSGAPQGT